MLFMSALIPDWCQRTVDKFGLSGGYLPYLNGIISLITDLCTQHSPVCICRIVHFLNKKMFVLFFID